MMISYTLSREESDGRALRRPTTRILTTDWPRTVLSKLSAINLFIASSIKQKTRLLLVTNPPSRDDLTKLHNDNLVSEVNRTCGKSLLQTIQPIQIENI